MIIYKESQKLKIFYISLMTFIFHLLLQQSSYSSLKKQVSKRQRKKKVASDGYKQTVTLAILPNNSRTVENCKEVKSVVTG